MADFENIAEEAELAFWAKVAEMCPEIKTGDFPPDLTFEMKEKMEYWIKHWYKGNCRHAHLEDYCPFMAEDTGKYCVDCGTVFVEKEVSE